MPLLRLLFCVMLATPAIGARAQERVSLLVRVDDENVRLATQIHKPAGPGPFATLIFHHGSTRRGDNPDLFAEVFDPRALTDWFVARGWAVVLPSRRGRGGSEGVYDEGFSVSRARGYSCTPALAIPGADRALRDIDAVTPAIMALPFVDQRQVMVGGQSRGGVLSVAHAGMHPTLYQGVINFAGLWNDYHCDHLFDKIATYTNHLLLGRGTATTLPMLWLYAVGDPYAPPAYSRESFAVFSKAGGQGIFHLLPKPRDNDGHALILYPRLWGLAVEEYLALRGLPAHPQPAPAAKH